MFRAKDSAACPDDDEPLVSDLISVPFSRLRKSDLQRVPSAIKTRWSAIHARDAFGFAD